MRRVLVSAVVCVLALAGSAEAKAKPLVITDLTGDANGVNGQGFGAPVPDTATGPASVTGADITSLTLTNLFKGKKPKGFTVTLRTAGPLVDQVQYGAVLVASAPCGGTDRIQLGRQGLGAASVDLAICQGADGTGMDSTTVGYSTADSAKGVITWQIYPGLFPAGTTISLDYASTSAFVVGVADELRSDKVFTYGR